VDEMLNDRSPGAHVDDSTHSFDRAATRDRIEQLAALPHDWNGYGACPIDPDVIESASRLIDRLSFEAISAPQVVPMTRGRLQFEWHRGRRSLELELETPTLVHYLKYDPGRGIEEEATLPVEETSRLLELLHWFHEE
jgi:hypothetical protein